MDAIWQDVRQGARLWARNPWFSAAAVLVLALGIGPTTAIFSLVNAILLTPQPYPESHRIVRISQIQPALEGIQRAGTVPLATFKTWRDATKLLEQVAVYLPHSSTLTGQGDATRLSGTICSPALFPLLRARPFLGRLFAPDNEKAGNDRVVLLAYTCWEKQFGRDSAVLGKTIRLEGADYEVLGVMPAGFDFPAHGTEYWIPFVPEEVQRNAGELRVRMVPLIARLKPGVTVAQAVAEGNSLAQEAERPLPKREGAQIQPSIQMVTLQEQLVGPVRPALIALFGAVGFVLLIACANVAGLLLTRAAGRQKEIAVRAALGAGRGRLIQQLLVESFMLSVAGGGLGLLLGCWGIDLLPAVVPGNIPRIDEIHIDHRVLGFALGISLLTGLLFGLAPARKSGQIGLVQALKEGGMQAQTGLRLFRYSKMRSLLTVFEHALALMLLIGAGLLINSFFRMISQDPGYDPRGVLALQVSLPQTRYEQPETQMALFQRLLESLRDTSGVVSAGLAHSMPMSPTRMMMSFEIPGRILRTNPNENILTGVRLISPGFVKAMGIPILHGRDFNDRDRQGAQSVALVNQTFVRRFLGGENPIGKTIDLMEKSEIIGVIGDVKPQGLDSDPQPETMLCYHQYGQMLGPGGAASSPYIVIRTSGDPLAIVQAIRTQVKSLDPELPVYNVSTMEQRVANSVAQPRSFAILLGIFAFTALVLAVVGMYGILSHHVAQSTREIGIRMALGAERTRIFRLVLGQGAALAGMGLVLGVGGAWASSRVLAKFLFGIKPVDAATYTSTAALMACIALLAAYIPARRAMSVDPIIALRQE